MPCLRAKSRATTPYDAKEALGMRHGWGASAKDRRRGESVEVFQARVLAEQIEKKKSRIIPAMDRFHICGELNDTRGAICARCGRLTDVLCDYPMGGGGTCDLPMCDGCALHVGEDLDLCPLHFAEWSAKARTEAIRPWPPKSMK